MSVPSFLIRDYEIGHYSGYRTIVHAEYFYELTSEDNLEKIGEAYRFAKSENLPFLIISWGTNMLFAREYFSWVVVKNSLYWWEYEEGKKILHTYSNESIWDIAETLEKECNNPLWHRFIGLPGSIGWAIYGNAGCFGLETESNFIEATIYDMEKWVKKTMTQADMKFSYRYSLLKEYPYYFIVDAKFDLSEKREKYHSDVDNIDFRENKQPKGNSCGSFWKNPSRDLSAGTLIESVGLKWYRHGGARWSELHANFLLSAGESCKPSDLFELIELTRERVKREKWIELENEVKIVGYSVSY